MAQRKALVTGNAPEAIELEIRHTRSRIDENLAALRRSVKREAVTLVSDTRRALRESATETGRRVAARCRATLRAALETVRSRPVTTVALVTAGIAVAAVVIRRRTAAGANPRPRR